MSESESVLINACFREPDSLPLILDEVKPEDFSNGAHSKAFAAISSLYREGKPIDPYAVAKCAGIPTTDFWHEELFYPEIKLEYHTQQVREQGQRKRLRLALKGAIDLVQDESRELADVQAQISDRLFKTLSDNQQHKDRDIAGEVLALYEQRKQECAQGKSFAGIETGITALDNLIGGLQPGTLTVIGGRSNHGKSTLAMDFFFRAGKDGVPSLYISLEQPVPEIFLHLLHKYTGISPLIIKKGTASPQQEAIFRAAIKKLVERPCYFEDNSSKLSDIVLKIKGKVLSKKIKLVVVDYIQQIENRQKNEARHLEVSSVSRALKRLAMDTNIAIVALTQINKESEGRVGNKIYLSDCRESEAISHDADAVIFLNRPSEYNDDGADFIELAKNRHGERVPKIPVRWDAKYNAYSEL